MAEGEIKTLDDLALKGKRVLLRCDINSPIDPEAKKIKDDTRIKRSLPTLRELCKKGAKTIILAHQGDPMDYQNFTTLEEHRDYLQRYLSKKIKFVEDIAGPAAQMEIKNLREGEILLLENIRIYSEETIIFEQTVKLSPEEQCQTYLVKKLSKLADFYICDAFACVHRSEPSLVALPQILPSAAGRLFQEELTALTRVKSSPQRPCLYILGGAKILDAFRMMDQVLKDKSADMILTIGLVGQIMLKAKGYNLGEENEKFLENKGLTPYVQKAKEILKTYGKVVFSPRDIAVAVDGQKRREIPLSEFPPPGLISDIGNKTIEEYLQYIREAKTIFLNGPAGVYEQREFQKGTEKIWEAVADSPAFSVIGGGDTIAATKKFDLQEQISYICTAGGGMVRFLSGEKLPVIEALES